MTNILVRVSWTVTEILSSILEIVFSLLLTVLLAPTLLVLYIINLLIRFIIQLIFTLSTTHPKFQLLTDGADGIWSYKKFGNSRNILIIYIYKTRISLEKLQFNYEHLVLDHVAEDGTKPYDRLRKIFTKKFGYYCWKDSMDFNIKNHVKNITTEMEIVSESDLKQLLPKLAADMDETKPQWEELIIPRFRYDDEVPGCVERSARIYRSHHAFMDGVSNLMMTGTCMGDCEKFPYVLNPLAKLRIPTWKIMLYNVNCVILGALTVVRNIYEATQLKSRFLMKKYSGKQIFAWSEPISMSVLKETKEKTRTSIPSIFATVAVTSLQNLEDKNYPEGKEYKNYSSCAEPEITSIGMVGAVIPYLNINPKNRFTVVNFGVRTSLSTKRIERLKKTHKEFLTLTQKPDGLVNYKLFQIFGKFPSFVIQFMMRGAGTPVIYSNTPWATEKVSLWGDEVKDVLGWMPLLTTAGVGLLTVSYSTSFRFCIIADESCLSEKEMNFLVSEIYNEIQLLHKESKEIGLMSTSSGKEIFSV